MNGIKWTNHKFSTEKLPWYKTRIGCIELSCIQVIIVHATKNRKGIKGWDGSVYFGNKWVASIKTRKILELARQDVERLAIEYLFGHGYVILNGLKKVGLLGEMLSQVGIELPE